MKVRVYWNLHKECWSVMDNKTRKVIKHLTTFSLHDAEFKVYEKGRQRVIKEQRKNVHGFVIGELIEDIPDMVGEVTYYNPYLQSTFTIDGVPVYNASIVKFHLDRKVLTIL